MPPGHAVNPGTNDALDLKRGRAVSIAAGPARPSPGVGARQPAPPRPQASLRSLRGAEGAGQDECKPVRKQCLQLSAPLAAEAGSMLGPGSSVHSRRDSIRLDSSPLGRRHAVD